MNLPDEMKTIGVQASDSFASWFPDKYRTKIEFYPAAKNALPYDMSDSLLSFDTFYNTNHVKRFFNSFFNGNRTATTIEFGLKYSGVA
jgi:hypothetical protein